MSNGKIDFKKLHQLVTEGKSGREIAKHFGVTPGAISQAKKRLKIAVIKDTALEAAHKIRDKSLNAADQLYKINQEANRLLDTLEKEPDLKIKVMKEIRGQLKLQLEIFQCLYDMQSVQEFQAEVLDIIASVDPEVRDEIIYQLKKRSALRSALQFN
jgi:transposase